MCKVSSSYELRKNVFMLADKDRWEEDVSGAGGGEKTKKKRCSGLNARTPKRIQNKSGSGLSTRKPNW